MQVRSAIRAAPRSAVVKSDAARWWPVGATLAADFQNGLYMVNGAGVSLTDLFTAGDPSGFVTPQFGFLVSSTGSWTITLPSDMDVQGTLYIQGRFVNDSYTNGFPEFMRGGAGTELQIVARNTGITFFGQMSTGGAPSAAVSGEVAPGDPFWVYAAHEDGDLDFKGKGEAIVSASGGNADAIQVIRMGSGSNLPSTDPLWIQSIVFWPRVLTDAEMTGDLFPNAGASFDASAISSTALFGTVGDSLLDQGFDAANNAKDSRGWTTHLESQSTGRIEFDIASARAVSGRDAGEVLAALTTDLAAMDSAVEAVFVGVGANDVAGNRSIAQFASDVDAIVSQILADDKKVILVQPFPRNQAGGSSLTSAQQALYAGYRAHIAGKSASGVLVVDAYSALLDSGTVSDPNTTYYNDTTHLGVPGAVYAAEVIWAQMERAGFVEGSVPTDQGNFPGVGTTSGYGTTGVGSLSSNGSSLTFSGTFPDSASNDVTVFNEFRNSGLPTTGMKISLFAEFTVVTESNEVEPYLQLVVTDGSGATTYIGMDRPFLESLGNTPGGGKRYYVETPTAVMPSGLVSLNGQFRVQKTDYVTGPTDFEINITAFGVTIK